jgi:DNA-binding GntR family transcriptional regulator
MQTDEVIAAPSGLARGRATDQAADRLREMILDGALPPASRISERMLQERLGISRTPLREALKVLGSEGLVMIEPNRGAIVTRLSLDELESAFELLAVLDGAAGEMACRRASDAEIEAIAKLHDEMVDCYRACDMQGYFRLNKAIHLAIVDAAGNPSLARIYRLESARVDRYRYVGNRAAANWARSIRQHEQLLDALKARQGPLLRECLVAHRASGFRLAREQYEREAKPPSRLRAPSEDC